jgi:uncharacterized protein YcsI (UPF0317 family)
MDDMIGIGSGREAALQAAQTLRGEVRAGRWCKRTTGMARGVVQGNLVILPAEYAEDFRVFCELNPKPCPLIGMTEPGDPRVPALGDDIDLRTDLSGYRIFEHGVATNEVHDISDYWRDDFVGFVLGCSYSFEEALMQDGLTVRHIENGTKAYVYRTNVPTKPSGPFSGPTIVSMRPFTPPGAIRAIEITSRFPDVHGAPIHFGDPSMIGIDDISKPFSGPSPEIRTGEVPVFWACGVTPQAVLEEAKVPFAITHNPGYMLVTDRLNAEFSTA